MNDIVDMITRGWDNFIARPAGPLNLRFIIQPVVAAVIALHAGLQDAREGKPPYLWSALTDSVYRAELLRGGWKDIRLPIFIAVTLDVIYQMIIHHWVYPLELIFTATLLVLIPYLLLRGLVTRIAKAMGLGKRTSQRAVRSNRRGL